MRILYSEMTNTISSLVNPHPRTLLTPSC
jgi:hypothetical protein